jgi:transposase
MRKVIRIKSIDIENLVRATLLGFGVRFARGGWRKTFDRRVRVAAGANQTLVDLVEPLLAIRQRMLQELEAIERQVRLAAEADPICRRLMTAPGIGPIAALSYKAAIDEPARFARSRDVPAIFGLTPAARQSGESDPARRISRRGDAFVRHSLFLAAAYQLRTYSRPSWLKDWANAVAERRGRLKAIVATARRLAVILHQMWVTESDFRWAPTVA